jgi:hypothetical protein
MAGATDWNKKKIRYTIVNEESELLFTDDQ